MVQYVDVESADVHEHFLAFTEADALNAEGLCVYILQALDTFKLDPAAIVSQGMGISHEWPLLRCSAANQAGSTLSSVVHCYAHCLNLALVDTTKSF